MGGDPEGNRTDISINAMDNVFRGQGRYFFVHIACNLLHQLVDEIDPFLFQVPSVFTKLEWGTMNENLLRESIDWLCVDHRTELTSVFLVSITKTPYRHTMQFKPFPIVTFGIGKLFEKI